MSANQSPAVPQLALEGILKGDVPTTGVPAAELEDTGEQEAEPLLLVVQQCERMLAQGARSWDAETVPLARSEELGRTVRAALQSFNHSIYLRGMVEHAYDDDEGFLEKPPPRSVLLVLKRACAEFAAVRGEEEAFRVVG